MMSGGSQLQNKLGVDVDISYDERSVRLFDVNLRGSIRITASDTGGIDVPSLYDEEASELGAKILSGLREGWRRDREPKPPRRSHSAPRRLRRGNREQRTLPKNTRPHSPIRTRTTSKTVRRLSISSRPRAIPVSAVCVAKSNCFSHFFVGNGFW